MLLTNLHTVKDFARILFSWKYHMLAVYLIIVGLVGLYAYFWTPTYLTSATILVLPKSNANSVITTSRDPNSFTPVNPQEINTEMEMLKSNDVLRKTIQSFLDENQAIALNLPKDQLSWLVKAVGITKKKLKQFLVYIKLLEEVPIFNYYLTLLYDSLETEQVVMTNMFTVTLEAESAKAAKVVLDRLIKVYVKHHDVVYSNVQGGELFSTLTDKFFHDLEKTETEINRLLGENQIIDIDLQNKENVMRLSQLLQDLGHLEVDISEKEDQIYFFEKSLEGKIAEIAISREMHAIPAILELDKALVPLLMTQNEIKRKYSENSSNYKNITSQIELLRTNIRTEMEKAFRTSKIELQTMIRKKENLQEKFDALRTEGLALTEHNAKLQNLLRMKDFQMEKLKLYASKLEDTKTSEERLKRDLANVRIVDYPDIPVKMDSPKRLLIIVLSLFFGFFAAICSAVFLEFIDFRVKTAADVESSVKLKVISAYPKKDEKKV
ncbi:MAG: hypothetical protein KKE17_10040 [Proteobacteria bacterium]|nr:hypothetical protein [Pseudomonadota bacterium]MBU1710333.1 hypothetical protein [Pseudomonadota bacterium]